MKRNRCDHAYHIEGQQHTEGRRNTRHPITPSFGIILPICLRVVKRAKKVIVERERAEQTGRVQKVVVFANVCVQGSFGGNRLFERGQRT